MATMLQLIQQATGELGIPVPTVVAGNTTQDTVQQLALLNACGYELLKEHPWQGINKQHIITISYTTITADTTLGSTSLTNCSSIVGIDDTYQVTGSGINQATYVTGTPSGTTIQLTQPATSTNVGQTYTLGKVKYALPSDYDRQIPRTHWDKSKHWEMLGPETPEQWEWLISGYISTGPRIRYRLLGNKFQIWPIITTKEVLGFEYVSNAWVTDVGGNAKSSFTLDTDTCMFPDRLMVLALKKKYLEIKGFDTTAVEKAYQTILAATKAADEGAPNLSFSPRISTILIGWEQIPDSGYGS